LNARLVIHQPECISGDVESAALKPRPLFDTPAHEVSFEPPITKLPFRGVDSLLLPVAWVVAGNERSHHVRAFGEIDDAAVRRDIVALVEGIAEARKGRRRKR